jgi:hypothetical protein
LFGLLSLGIILFSLGIGILGYMSTEGMNLVDAFLNAAMIMGGMGPVSVLYTKWRKDLRRIICDVLRICSDLLGCNFYDAGIPSLSPSLPS